MEILTGVSTLWSTVTVHDRLNSVPLNGVAVSVITTEGAGTE